MFLKIYTPVSESESANISVEPSESGTCERWDGGYWYSDAIQYSSGRQLRKTWKVMERWISNTDNYIYCELLEELHPDWCDKGLIRHETTYTILETKTEQFFGNYKIQTVEIDYPKGLSSKLTLPVPSDLEEQVLKMIHPFLKVCKQQDIPEMKKVKTLSSQNQRRPQPREQKQQLPQSSQRHPQRRPQRQPQPSEQQSQPPSQQRPLQPRLPQIQLGLLIPPPTLSSSPQQQPPRPKRLHASSSALVQKHS